MTQSTLSARVVRFDSFEVDRRAGELRKHGRRIRLQEQPFQILAMLLERPGELVTREEIQRMLWPADTFVDFDHGVNSAVRRLRDALNDSAETPRFIETIPRKGYRFIGQLAAELPTPETHELPDRRISRGWKIGAVVLAFAFLLGIWILQEKRSELSPIEVTPLAGLSGDEEGPAFSADGHQVAFHMKNSGIFTTIVGGDKALQLTSDPGDCCAAWSPDGRQVAFLRLTDSQLGVFVISALGGTERLLYSGHRPLYPSLAWSPDGSVLAFPESSAENVRSSIALLSLADSTIRRLTSPPDDSRDNGARFSPDGSKIAFDRGTIAGVVNDIFVVPAEGGEARRLTFDACQTYGLAWTPDGREIVFSSQRGGQQSLWRVLASGGKPRPVAGTGLMAYSPAVSTAGHLLAYQQAVERDNIWQLRLKDERHSLGTPTVVVSAKGTKLRPQFSPDGKRISFESDRLGNTEIWACEGGENCAQLTTLHGTTGTARWSPDGRHIAFEYHPGPRAEIFVLDVPAGTPRLLTTIPGADNLVPSWSRDSEWIYFTSKKGSTPFQLWKVPANGGTPVAITKNGGLAAVESSEGRWLYYAKYEAGGIWRTPIAGGDETRVLAEPAGPSWFDWVLARNGIYYFSPTPPHQISLKYFDFSDHNTTAVLTLDKPIGWGLALSPDDKSLLYVESEYEQSDIMLVRNFR